MNQIDARGQACPKPLILARKAMKKAEPGTEISLLLGSQNACTNITNYLKGLETPVTQSENGKEITLTFINPERTTSEA